MKLLVTLINGKSLKKTCKTSDSILSLSSTDQQLMSNVLSSLQDIKTHTFIFEDGTAVPLSSILSIELVDKINKGL